MLRRIREALRNEAGNYLISTMIGSIVLLIVVGAISAGILGVGLFQQAITDRSDITKQISLTDATFRADVLWAASITATDSHTVQMTVPGQNGQCKVTTWTISTAAGKTTVADSVVSYPAFDATVNPVACTGTASAPAVQTFVDDAAPDSTFTYANAGRRGLVFTAGAGVPADGAAPAGVTPKAWASTQLAAVALDTSSASSTDRKYVYRIAQTAENLSVVAEAADAPSFFVPQGNLTALP